VNQHHIPEETLWLRSMVAPGPSVWTGTAEFQLFGLRLSSLRALPSKVAAGTDVLVDWAIDFAMFCASSNKRVDVQTALQTSV